MESTNPVLKPAEEGIRDGENNAVLLDFAYTVRGDGLQSCLAEITRQHGDRILYLPLSGTSAGGGVFQVPAPVESTIIGLKLATSPQPRISIDSDVCLTEMALDEIHINTLNREISAGAGITLDQLNVALRESLGQTFRVLGADLTSYTYAQTGSTFMTGGMGPQRRYFSDSVIEIALHNGKEITTIASDDLLGYAGTYGWTGIVTAVKCRFHRLPENEIAFALPVSNSADAVSLLLEHFSDWCFLDTSSEKLVNSSNSPNILLGLEHITRSSMQPLLDSTKDPRTLQRARQLSENCSNADADGLIFVNGFSDLESDEFLMQLIDDPASDSPTICGMNLEYTEVFPDADEMRQFREAVPYAARTQEPRAKYVYKNHTDATIRLNPDAVAESMKQMWKINLDYVSAVEECIGEVQNLDGAILMYGHMNPWGVDPHNRITFASDDQSAFELARIQIESLREKFYRQLKDLCDETGSQFIGGEKGADSEHKMYAAFGGTDSAPADMQKKFRLQAKAVAGADPRFSWRAFEPYRSPI